MSTVKPSNRRRRLAAPVAPATPAPPAPPWWAGFQVDRPASLAELWSLAGPYRDVYYRGLVDARFELTPRVARDEGHREGEWNMMSEFSAAARSHGHALRNNLELLALAQHHGLPTRLMDVTSAFGVALYFAVQAQSPSQSPSPAHDCVVWCIDAARMQAALCTWFERRSTRSKQPVSTDYTSFPAPPTLHRRKVVPVATDPAIDAMIDLYLTPARRPRQPPVIISTPHISQRIAAQDASFLVIDPSAGALGAQLAALGCADVLSGIAISPAVREQARDHLRKLGMTRRLLFPDIDNLAVDLTESYARGR